MAVGRCRGRGHIWVFCSSEGWSRWDKKKASSHNRLPCFIFNIIQRGRIERLFLISMIILEKRGLRKYSVEIRYFFGISAYNFSNSPLLNRLSQVDDLNSIQFSFRWLCFVHQAIVSICFLLMTYLEIIYYDSVIVVSF